MFDDPLVFIPIGAVLVVALILLTGIGGFAKGGEFNRKNANKLMRWRIYAQAVAIAVILGYIWFRSRG
ncbi:twin transmembrane helix small protein [Maritimibacter sp. DP1N21-5]|uniref:twin transmembrane helix small protein n=1 Tax=Maritimibacter sp. DP1N21-5 TaxID=2836867 RepID=UPI001C44135F|nr:twin transmembrane helix small protein [Maritimibacter sp. DP1N21-5]MBV7408481.1 twin transmembrane helix small protein [Maritimibacter sp. DP1N21-5]